MQRPEALTRWLYAVPGQSPLSAWLRVAAAVLAGGAHAASLAWPWPASILSILGLNPGQPVYLSFFGLPLDVVALRRKSESTSCCVHT